MRPLALLAVLSSAALAGPAPKAPPKLPDVYTVRVKTGTSGAITYVPIAEVSRASGNVTVKALAAPELDKLAATFDQQWKAFKPSPKITVTEMHPNNTGMRPTSSPHSATFTVKDKLYQAATVKEFADKFHYEVLGLSSVNFIIWDRSAESPAGANDRASTFSNFRKNPEGLNYNGTYESMFVSVVVRKHTAPGDGERVSATDPKLKLSMHNDEGTQEVAWLKLHEDGTIAVEIRKAGESFASSFGTFTPHDLDLPVVIGGEYKSLHVSKKSPFQLEAQLLDAEERELYDITPAIDPALLR